MAEKISADYKDKNLATAVILVENASGAPPTAADCKAWRSTYGLYNVAALYDPTGVTKALYEQPYTALSVFVGMDRVIKNKLHTDVESQLHVQLSSLLQ